MTGPTGRLLTGLATDVLELSAQRRAVLAIHRRVDSADWCGVCVDEDNEEQPWPCETVRALGVTS